VSYLSKVAYFDLPSAFVVSFGVTLIEFRRNFWHQKLESMSYRVLLFA